MAIIPQTQSFKLFGAGASIGATSITLHTFKNLDGSNLTMAHFGGSKGFLTLEPSSGSQEEQVSFASITNNANGTVTLGTIKNVLDYTPFTETNGLAKTHGGNVEVIVSNTSGFYNNVVAGTTASQIINIPAGTISSTDLQSAINELDGDVTNLSLHKAGAEIVTGKKTFTLATRPVLDTDTDSSVATEFVTFGQLSRSPAAGGAANSSTTVKGINQEATDAQVVASTPTGSTGARLYINPSSVGLTANKIPYLDSNGRIPLSLLNTSFGDGSDGDVTITGTFQMTRDMYYNNLVVTGTLVTAGFIVFVKETISGAGTIKCDGSQVWTGRFQNGAGGTPNSYAVSPSAAQNGASVTSSTGGAGGNSSYGATGGTVTGRIDKFGISATRSMFGIDTLINGIQTSYKGGAGGAAGIFRSVDGGYGGAGGGVIMLVCKNYTGSFSFNVNGGNGGNGANGFASYGSGGGGGGGGGGGSIFVVYVTKTWTGGYTANGGTGGLGGTIGDPYYSPTPGLPGLPGTASSGPYSEINYSNML